MFNSYGGYNRRKNPALDGAIRQPSGAFTPNNAPTGFGQPTGGGFNNGKPDDDTPEQAASPQPPQTQQDPTATASPQPQAQPQPQAPEPPPQAAPQPAPQAQARPATWNTDGYAGPAQTAQNAAQQAMAGWDQTKWGNQDHQTPKYAVGRILSQFAPKAENVGAAVAEIAKAYPGAKLVNGKEVVDIPGVGQVDLMKGFGNGGEAWQWGALTDKDGKPLDGPPPAPPRMGAAAGGPPSSHPLFNNPSLKQALMPGMQNNPNFFSGEGALSRMQALIAQLQSGGR